MADFSMSVHGDFKRMHRDFEKQTKLTERQAKQIGTLNQRLRELEKGGRGIQRTTQAFNQQERAVSRLNRTLMATQRFSRGISGALGAVGLGGFIGVAGVLAATRVLNANAQRAREMDKASSTRLLSRENSEAMFRSNLAGMKPADQRAAMRLPKELSGLSGVNIQDVTTVLAGAITASGQNVDATRAATLQALKLYPQSIEMASAAAEGTIDMMRVLADKYPRLNTKQLADLSQGYITRVGALGRVADPTAQAQTISKASTAAMAMGATPREAGALFATFTQAMVDTTGQLAQTALLGFGRGLENYWQANDLDKTLSFGGRIKYLQQNPKEAKEFFGMAGEGLGRAGAIAPIKNLLFNPQGSVGKMYSTAMRDFDTGPKSLQDVTVELMGLLRDGVIPGLGDLDRTLKMQVAKFEEVPEAVRRDLLVQQTIDVVEKTVPGFVGRKFLQNIAGGGALTSELFGMNIAGTGGDSRSEELLRVLRTALDSQDRASPDFRRNRDLILGTYRQVQMESRKPGSFLGDDPIDSTSSPAIAKLESINRGIQEQLALMRGPAPVPARNRGEE